MKKFFFIAILFAFLSSAAVASAFPFNYSWHEPAWGPARTNRTGAGGIYGVGSRTDFGIKCSDCHIEPEGRIGVDISTTPPFGNAGGEMTYAPGQDYQVTVRMTGEHLFGTMGSKNGMGLAIEDASGTPVGRYRADSGEDSNDCRPAARYPDHESPPGVTTTIYGDCHAVLSTDSDDLDTWSFRWTAPPAGAGDLRLFVAVVDGDTKGESSLDDDAVERTFTLVEE